MRCFCLLESDLNNFADDNTVSAIGQTIQELKSELERKAERAIEWPWIKNNNMIANLEKFKAKEKQNIDSFQMNISGKAIFPTDLVDLPGINIYQIFVEKQQDS